MGFFFRKSVRVGLLRLNFSSGGIGISAGIPGLRIGTGPRGSYVHAGGNGFYYRQSLGGASGRRGAARSSGGAPNAPRLSPVPEGPEHLGMVAIDSGDVMRMADASSSALLEQLAAARRAWRFAPLILACGAVLALVLLLLQPPVPRWVPLTVAVLGLLVAAVAAYFDAIRKTVVLFYDFDVAARARFQRLHDEFRKFAQAERVWHVQAQAHSRDRKYTAGAGTIVNRVSTTLSIGRPKFVKTNIEVPTIPVGAQTLYFFPDRLLVTDRQGVGAVPYSDLTMERTTCRFAETGSVPRDTEVDGHTWAYTNKSGGPDRRFKDNRQIPWARYVDVTLRSASGLHEMISLSRTQRSDELDAAIAELANAAAAIQLPATLEEEVRVAPQPSPFAGRRPSANSDSENAAQLAAALRALRNRSGLKERK